MKNRLRNDKGLTLLELVVALIIVTISVVALYYMYAQGQVLLEEQLHRRIALEKAQQRMEILANIRLTDVNRTRLLPESEGDEYLVHPDEEDETRGISAHYVVDVEQASIYDNQGNPMYETVSVTYTWVEPSGRDFEVKLVSIY